MRFRKLLTGAVVAFGMAIGGGAWANTIVNLGFAIDHSASMTGAEYTLQKNGLAAALSQLPVGGTVEYRVSVITFGFDVKTLVAPTVVTALNIGTIQSAITSHNRTNTSATITGDAINALTTLFDTPDFDIANTMTLFNISTDGQPNGGVNPVTAANNAFSAGVDSISVELIGTFTQPVIDAMLAITGPNSLYVTDAADLPNPATRGFVFAVADFDAYGAAIGAKVQQIVTPNVIPLPAGLPLLLAGIGAFAFMRRRQQAA